MAGLDRLERDSRRRRERAHSHLSRLRERGRGGREKRRLRLPRGLALAILVAAAGAGALADRAFLALGGAGRVTAIAVRGANRLTPQEVATATGIRRGAHVAEVEPEAVAQKLAQQDWIASARVLRLPSGRVLVGVVEREPLAQLAIGERRYAIDARGAAFAELAAGEEASLPRLVAGQAPERGVPDALRAEAAHLAERLPALGLAAPAEIRLAAPGDPEGVSLRLPGLDGVVVLGREALEERLRDLAKLLALRPDEASRAARIDLRFADQVVLRSAAARDGSHGAARSGGVAPPSTRTAG